jgi:fatty-acyl-CoA synthase
MQDAPLLISGILRRGSDYHAGSEVTSVLDADASLERGTFAEVGARAAQLAHALRKLGGGDGDRVATLCWNHQTHLENYLAVPSMGAVLHTLNLRLFPEQLAYVINHAQDDVIVVDASLVHLLTSVWDQLTTVRRVIVIGRGEQTLSGAIDFEDLIADEPTSFDWPTFEETRAASMCYTSGTTGNPKGVVYTHRSTVLHAMNVTSASTFNLTQHDRVLIVVPMFHAGAWGAPYGAFMIGADIILPRQFLQAPALARIIETTKPTWSAGVPTIWNDLLRLAETEDVDLSSMRSVCSGGAAASRGLIERFESRFGVQMVQGWGMTETSPLCALSHPPKGATKDERLDWQAKTGRILAGVEVRIVDDEGNVLARDGVSVGEFEVRGPWIASSYYGDDSGDRFHDGWLRTGDVGSLDANGFMRISDRSKDVIKTGGEWISSVELENAVMDHPDVFEAVAIGVADEKWSERPLVAVVRSDQSAVSASDLRRYLEDKVPRWWLPEMWTFIDEIPRTSVGKFDKKRLRASFENGELAVENVNSSDR